MTKVHKIALRRANGLVMGLRIAETDALSEEEFDALVAAWNALHIDGSGRLSPRPLDTSAEEMFRRQNPGH